MARALLFIVVQLSVCYSFNRIQNAIKLSFGGKLFSSVNDDLLVNQRNNTPATMDKSLEAAKLRKIVLLLSKEREDRRIELMATEMAINRAEAELQEIEESDSPTSAFISGTYDYGYQSKSAGSSVEGASSVAGSTVPRSALFLASDNFKRELNNLLSSFRVNEEESWSDADLARRKKLSQLTLSNDAIWKREKSRKSISAPWLIKAPYYLLCFLLDFLFDGRPISRFYFLETVARMPYFSYITMIHTYETLGWLRRSTEAKRIHFAEEYNEFHHLLIWESLGGDQEWKVRRKTSRVNQISHLDIYCCFNR